jgi:hypothetical protein
LVLAKVVTLHIPITTKQIIKDEGENELSTSAMECGDQTIYCAFERI